MTPVHTFLKKNSAFTVVAIGNSENPSFYIVFGDFCGDLGHLEKGEITLILTNFPPIVAEWNSTLILDP
jgi:hypothetical protein